jgi:hypothetical protein
VPRVCCRAARSLQRPNAAQREKQTNKQTSERGEGGRNRPQLQPLQRLQGVTNAFVVLLLTTSIFAILGVEFFSVSGRPSHGVPLVRIISTLKIIISA